MKYDSWFGTRLHMVKLLFHDVIERNTALSSQFVHGYLAMPSPPPPPSTTTATHVSLFLLSI